MKQHNAEHQSKKLKRAAHLSKVVEVVLMSNPFIRRAWFVDAVGLIIDVTNVWALAVIERTFKQLMTKTHNGNNKYHTSHTM